MVIKSKIKIKKEHLDNWITLVVDDAMIMAFQKILENPRNQFKSKGHLIRYCLKQQIPIIANDIGVSL
ncbi:hypothetical protein CCP1ISM_2690004 [Azospirillaceae bacterium]